MLWNGKQEFEDKYAQVLGSKYATELVFDHFGCSSDRVSDEVMAILAARVKDDQLEVIRFKNVSFGDVTLEQSLLTSLVLDA